MATTSPDNIWTPDSGDDYALTVDLAATADTVQDALTALRLNGATSGRGTTANRPAAGTLGMTYFATDTGILWYDTGSAWKNRTPGVFVGLISTTGPINGTNTLSWLLTITGFTGIDTAGFYSAGTPTRITLPYTGAYELAFTGRSNGVAPVTWQGGINGGTPSNYLTASGTGISGAATSGTRVSLMTFNAGDYLTWAQVSTATGLGNTSVTMKYLGEF